MRLKILLALLVIAASLAFTPASAGDSGMPGPRQLLGEVHGVGWDTSRPSSEPEEMGDGMLQSRLALRPETGTLRAFVELKS